MPASPNGLSDTKYVLRVEVVQRAIKQLRQQSFHQYFPAYLHLRQQAARRNSLTGLRPTWSELGTYLEVGDPPPDFPYYRPFIPTTMSNQSAWLNRNLAGSWAPSSLREGQPPLRVVQYDRASRSFTLREKHWDLARRHLLGDQQVNLIPLAMFLYRDFAVVSDRPPTGEDLVRVFCDDFGYRTPEDDEEFAYLYRVEIPSGSDGWFEPFVHGEGGGR